VKYWGIKLYDDIFLQKTRRSGVFKFSAKHSANFVGDRFTQKTKHVAPTGWCAPSFPQRCYLDIVYVKEVMDIILSIFTSFLYSVRY
jgi:hypothetical protein